MSFQDFLTVAQTGSWWQDSCVVTFTGAEYPTSFFALFFSRLKTLGVLPAPYQKINLETTDKKELQATLLQAPLGMNSFFWLGNISENKDAKDVQQKLTGYGGPHHLAYFVKTTPQTTKASQTALTIPSTLDFMLFEALAQFAGITLDAKKKTITKRLFANTNGINIELCCMIMQYLELTSSRTIDECAPFLTNIIGQSPMLSTLSEHFFAQQPAKFFPIWSVLEAEYPPVFWITFWSEQIWRAHHVIGFLQKKEFAAAKRMSIRLPYSFINRDWQKTDQTTLAKALEFLYGMDYAFKRGSTFHTLDLFYVRYFTGALKEA